jgi:hypothetical protein
LILNFAKVALSVGVTSSTTVHERRDPYHHGDRSASGPGKSGRLLGVGQSGGASVSSSAGVAALLF